MDKITDRKPSILNQVIRGVLIASAIGASSLMILSFLVRPPSGHGAVTTLTDIHALARAIEGFENEYEKLPDISLSDFEMQGPEAVNLITILLGKEEGGLSNMQNPRQIAFLAGRMTKHRKQGGIIFRSAYEVDGIYDSWGNPLRLVLREPGQTKTTFSLGGKIVTVDKPAAVLSRGPDMKWGTEDDLKSWEYQK
jgi:hypothetical protein